MQSCSFAFLHVCTFALSARRAGTAGNARTCKNTKFALFHFSGMAGMGKARMWWLAQAECAKVQKYILALSAGMAGMGKKDSVVSTKGICKSTKVQFFHFCTFGWYGWHCEPDEMQMVMQTCKAAVLHFCMFALLHFQLGELAQQMLEHKLCTFPLFQAWLAWAKQGCGGWHKQNMQKCICIFALSAGKAGMGSTFALSAGRAGTAGNAKLQKC